MSYKRGVFSKRKTYPSNWKELGEKVNARDGDSCYYCGKSRDELRKLGRVLQRHHLNSVRTGRNSTRNLVNACARENGTPGAMNAVQNISI